MYRPMKGFEGKLIYAKVISALHRASKVSNDKWVEKFETVIMKYRAKLQELSK